MEIRWAGPDDIRGIQDVAEASWNTDYRFISRDRLQTGVHEWYTQTKLQDALANPSVLLLVAVVNERVVGFSHTWADAERSEGDILRLYVHPDYRSQGIGQALFEETEITLAKHGITHLRATVLTENRLGNEFYQRLGFTKTGEEWTTIGGDWYRENTYVREPTDRSLPTERTREVITH